MSFYKIPMRLNYELLTKLKGFLTFIRFSHTLFALPFALGAMVVAAHGWPGWYIFLGILACMVFARTAAMTFNRIVDWEIDQRNPRTVGRHFLVNKNMAITVCIVSAIFFVIAAASINKLCFLFSPVALAFLFFYSLTKRFTSLAQFFLGLALAISPIGAWMAVTGGFALPPFILALGVVGWVAGFDIIYATQDVEIDRQEKLHSMVVWLGVPRALVLAQVLHLFFFVALIGFGIASHAPHSFYFFLLPVPFLLWYEHRIAKTLNVDFINRAFFQTNVLIGLIFVNATIVNF